MSRSIYGQWYENVMLVISVLSSMEYIWETYLNVSSAVDRQQLKILNIVELVVAVIFNLDWGLNLFMADHKLNFVTRYALHLPHTRFNFFFVLFIECSFSSSAVDICVVSFLWWICFR